MPTTSKHKAPNLREPWVFVPGLSRKLEFSIFGADGSELVESVQTTKADGFTVADVAAIGQKMSAAPDLYAALKQLVDHFGDPFKNARAALDKAEGSTQ